METIHIQFEANQNSSKVEGIPFFKQLIKKFATYILTRIIPTANPDFEGQIDNVKYWLVECDLESGIPQRESGLNSQREAIVKMPYEEKYGYWTDNNLVLDDFRQHFDVSEIATATFEQYWSMPIRSITTRLSPGRND